MRNQAHSRLGRLLGALPLLLWLGGCEIQEAGSTDAVDNTLPDNFAAELVTLSDHQNDYAVRLTWPEAEVDFIEREYVSEDATGVSHLNSGRVRFSPGEKLDRKVKAGVAYTYRPRARTPDQVFRPSQIVVTIPSDTLISNESLEDHWRRKDPNQVISGGRVYLKIDESIVWSGGRLFLRAERFFSTLDFEAPSLPFVPFSTPENPRPTLPGKIVLSQQVTGLQQFEKEGPVEFTLSAQSAKGELAIEVDDSFRTDDLENLSVTLFDPRGFKLSLINRSSDTAIKRLDILLGSERYLLVDRKLVPAYSLSGLYSDPLQTRFAFISYDGQRSDFSLGQITAASPSQLTWDGSAPIRSPRDLPAEPLYRVRGMSEAIPPVLLQAREMHELVYSLVKPLGEAGLFVNFRFQGNRFLARQLEMVKLLSQDQATWIQLLRERGLAGIKVTDEVAGGAIDAATRLVVIDPRPGESAPAEYRKLLQQVKSYRPRP